MNRRSILLAPAVLALAAMLGAAAPAAPRPPGAGEGLVYFYHARTAKRRKGRTVIKIDGRKVADLEVGQHTYIYLPAGEHSLAVTSGGALTGIGGTKFPLQIEPGQTHHIRYAAEVVGTIVIPDVTEPPPEEAKEEMRGSIHIRSKKGWVQ